MRGFRGVCMPTLQNQIGKLLPEIETYVSVYSCHEDLDLRLDSLLPTSLIWCCNQYSTDVIAC